VERAREAKENHPIPSPLEGRGWIREKKEWRGDFFSPDNKSSLLVTV